MNRRELLLGCVAAQALWLIGCGEKDPGHGPGKIHWDRDTCVRCRMIISDRHYAAQIRGGEKRTVYKFDDIGCALFWLKEQNIPWAEAPDTELWVTHYKTGEWLDARTARYIANKTTPMLYGFGATHDATPGSVDFATMKAAILAKGR